jgi:phosphoglycerate dehydrogenase-like enzyme
MPRVLILDDYQRVALTFADWAGLPEDCEVVSLSDHLEGDGAFFAAVGDAEIVVAMRERTAFTAARLDRLPNLRLLVTTGMANAAIDLEAAARNGVVVSGTEGRPGATVELTWALILAVARQIPREDAGMRAGVWQQTVGFELRGRTLGLVGLGRLGAAMVPVARAFGMDAIAWSQNLTAAAAAGAGARAVTKEELFVTADVVSVHYKLSERSRGLVGTEDIARMQPSAYLVNTSRGPIVDTAALLDALNAGRIAGAGIDVYDTEPLPAGDPLRSAPRTVLTPHLGYVSGATYEVFFGQAVEDIAAFLAGAPIRTLTPGAG